jgi:hypothetical protein
MHPFYHNGLYFWEVVQIVVTHRIPIQRSFEQSHRHDNDLQMFLSSGFLAWIEWGIQEVSSEILLPLPMLNEFCSSILLKVI